MRKYDVLHDRLCLKNGESNFYKLGLRRIFYNPGHWEVGNLDGYKYCTLVETNLHNYVKVDDAFYFHLSNNERKLLIVGLIDRENASRSEAIEKRVKGLKNVITNGCIPYFHKVRYATNYFYYFYDLENELD